MAVTGTATTCQGAKVLSYNRDLHDKSAHCSVPDICVTLPSAWAHAISGLGSSVADCASVSSNHLHRLLSPIRQQSTGAVSGGTQRVIHR